MPVNLGIPPGSVVGQITPISTKVCQICNQPLRYKLRPGKTAIPWDAVEDRSHDCNRPSQPQQANQVAPSAAVPAAGAALVDPQPLPTIPPVAPATVAPLGALEASLFASMSPAISGLVQQMLRDHVAPAPAIHIHKWEMPAMAPGSPSTIEICHPMQARLVHTLSMPKTPGLCGAWLIGPAGSGKSYSVIQAGRILGYAIEDIEEISICTGMYASHLLGYRDGNGAYIDTAFYRAYKYGRLLLIDEIDKADGGVLAAIQSGIEANRCSFPCGMVDRHPDFKVVIASPTAGLGPSSAYPASLPLPADFRSRWLKLDWQVDHATEHAIAATINVTAKAWVDWVQAVRGWVKAQLGGRLVVSPRMSYQGARILGCMPTGLGVTDMAREMLGEEMDAATFSRLMRDHPLPQIQVERK